jgi:formate dehydrogenase subunit beta
MSIWAAVPGDDAEGAVGATRSVLAALLESRRVRGLLVMMRTHDGRSVQPALVTVSDRLRHADPFLPVMPIHLARMASLVSVHGGNGTSAEGRIGIVARPCELRGLIELAKLNQLRAEDFVTIAIDCVGTLEGAAWKRWSESDSNARIRQEDAMREGAAGSPAEPYRHACSLCETPVAWDADLAIHVIGVKGGVLLEARDADGLPPSALPVNDAPGRAGAVERLISERRATRQQALDAMQVRMQAGADGLPGLMLEFEACQRCHNCTVACPICYCKECLFRTDTFQHEPRRYFGWADRKGAARLPGDAVAFQLTRLCHVTTSCVGCGMCTSACPAELPVDLLFQTVARRTQAMFDYVPGRRLDEALPPATFERKEFIDLGEVHR